MEWFASDYEGGGEQLSLQAQCCEDGKKKKNREREKETGRATPLGKTQGSEQEEAVPSVGHEQKELCL